MSRTGFLTFLILVGLVAGSLVGEFFLYEGVAGMLNDHWTRTAGEIVLIRPLTMLIVPIVFISVVVGVTSIGDPSKLGVVGGSTVLYYLVTMILAVTLGVTLVSTFLPGELPQEAKDLLTQDAAQQYESSGISETIELATSEDRTTLGRAFLEVVKQLIPKNIIEEMAGEFEGRAKIAKMDVDQHYKTPQSFGIRSIPTLLIFKDGVVVDQIVGVVPKKVLADKLESHMVAVASG